MSHEKNGIVLGLLLAVMAVAPVGAQAVPAIGLKKAAHATKVLGDQVVQANFSYTIQRMYPRWKARAAKRHGGEAKLAEALAKVPDEMKKNGITILSFKVGEPVSSFLVPEYSEWLVFVPTTTVYLITDPETGKPRRLESKSYQVAVSKEGKDDWYFIDGGGMSISMLRSMFPSLPKDEARLRLPLVSGLTELK